MSVSNTGINEAGGRKGGTVTPISDRPEEIHSAAPQDGCSGRKNLVFRTAKDIAAMTASDVPWIAKPWVARGSITDLVGKVKLAGKTTFTAELVAAVLDGRDFLDETTVKTPVLWLTEQNATTFRQALGRAGLVDREDLFVLFWHETLGVPWEEVAAAALEEAQRRGAGLLVVDTLGQFAGLRGDSENSAGDALRAVEPLQKAAATGLGVIVVRHERKSGGDVGDSGRGSSAFAGAVDIVLALRRPNKSKRPTIRQLGALSRFDETPSELMIELAETGYLVLGSERDVAHQEAREAILREAPSAEDQALSFDELLTRLPGVKRTVAQTALGRLRDSSEMNRIGAGKKGHPFRWYRSASKGGAAEDPFGRMPTSHSGRINLVAAGDSAPQGIRSHSESGGELDGRT